MSGLNRWGVGDALDVYCGSSSGSGPGAAATIGWPVFGSNLCSNHALLPAAPPVVGSNVGTLVGSAAAIGCPVVGVESSADVLGNGRVAVVRLLTLRSTHILCIVP